MTFDSVNLPLSNSWGVGNSNGLVDRILDIRQPAPLSCLPTLARVTLRRGQRGGQEKSWAAGSVGYFPRTQRGLNTAAPGTIPNGKNSGIEVFGCGLKSFFAFLSDPELRCGVVLK